MVLAIMHIAKGTVIMLKTTLRMPPYSSAAKVYNISPKSDKCSQFT